MVNQQFFLMSFRTITGDLQTQLKSNLPQIRLMLKRNPAMAFTKITEIGSGVGKKYGIKLIVNFPERGKINDFDSYGKQDLSIIVDQSKKNFPIDRSIVKTKATEIFGDDAEVQDAYMYEQKEGVRVIAENGRIDVLPHSLHVWCKFSDKVSDFCDWLFENVYKVK